MLSKLRFYIRRIINHPKDTFYFFQGYLRYFLISVGAVFLIRKHIMNQIRQRYELADKECLKNGSCKICGCSMPQLLMSDKGCEGGCYPRMKNKKEFKLYKIQKRG